MLKWAASLDQMWQTPGVVSLVAIAGAIFLSIVLIVIAFRAGRTAANGALVVITLAAVAAMGAMLLGHDRDAPVTTARAVSAPSLAALACLDGMAGDGVESACEKVLFASPDATAAAVSYAASQLSRLTPSDALTSKSQTPEGTTLRRALERDRFGLVAQVLTVREGCTPNLCPVFRILSDPSRIIANMNDRVYETTVGRYALAWGSGGGGAVASAPAPAMTSSLAAPNVPTGRPVNIDFPSAASTPAVNIMIGEVPSSPTLPAARAPAAATAKQTPPAAPKKQPAQQAARQKAPVQLAPKAPEPEEPEEN